MFTFLDDESDLTFERKVTVNHPANGKQTFTATFAVIEQDEIDELIRDDVALLRRVFVGWGGEVRDADKQPLEFSPATRDAMLKRPYIRTALVKDFIETIGGARRGN